MLGQFAYEAVNGQAESMVQGRVYGVGDLDISCVADDSLHCDHMYILAVSDLKRNRIDSARPSPRS